MKKSKKQQQLEEEEAARLQKEAEEAAAIEKIMAVEREKRRLEEIEIQAKKDLDSKAVFLEGRWRGDGLILKEDGSHLPITQQIDFVALKTEPYAIVEIQ